MVEENFSIQFHKFSLRHSLGFTINSSRFIVTVSMPLSIIS
jgi:hypothetical protein